VRVGDHVDRLEDGETAKHSFIDGASAKVDLVPSDSSGTQAPGEAVYASAFPVRLAKALMTMFSN
jgi:hypothetical protein